MFALELLEGELAAELPAHMRAFARAYAEGRPPPPAPDIATRPSTLAMVRAARSLTLLRLVVPLVIESDPAVVAARREAPTWAGLAKLAAARDAASRVHVGCGAIELMHRLHGVARLQGVAHERLHDVADERRASNEIPPPVDGWRARTTAIDVDATWRALAGRFRVNGHVRIERSDAAHPRAFVVEPQREVIVVVPRVIDTPVARFALLHELGHAIVALALPAGVPRVVDEAGAAYVARLGDEAAAAETDFELARRATERRIAIAALFDRVERRLPDVSDVPGAKPPWALWHDPGAQAAYIEAEAIADRLTDDEFAERLQAERARIDARTRV